MARTAHGKDKRLFKFPACLNVGSPGRLHFFYRCSTAKSCILHLQQTLRVLTAHICTCPLQCNLSNGEGQNWPLLPLTPRGYPVQCLVKFCFEMMASITWVYALHQMVRAEQNDDHSCRHTCVALLTWQARILIYASWNSNFRGCVYNLTLCRMWSTYVS